MLRYTRSQVLPAIALVWLSAFATSAMAQGIVLPGAGAINRGMAGASVAAPIDASGALLWNPASISGLPRSEAAFSGEFLYPRTKLTSAIPASSFGPGIPPVPLAGTNQSNSGVPLLPTIGFVQQSYDSPWTFGLGLFTIGGVNSNYHASTTNPILTPQPPAGFGGGAVYSELTILQFAPTAALQITDNVSIGFAPTFNVADFGVGPALFAAPDDANGDGFPSYPDGTHARLHWGLGFQVGVYVEQDSGWSFGASYKSPQWFETIEANSTNELGLPRTLKLQMEFPSIVSVGASYRGFDRTTIALDVRYIDYKNSKFFGDAARFDPGTGAALGLGWRGVLSVAAGLQHELNEKLTVRLGYLWTQNPVPGSATFFLIPSASIYEHTVFVGTSQKLTEKITLSLAYYHAFRNSITGLYQSPAGPIAGSTVHLNQETDGLVGGISVYF